MKYARKTFATVIAFMCLMNVTTPMSSMATYDPCDVNRDGRVSIADALAINKQLSGVQYATNYHLLDANQSHTIDATDANCVMQKAMGNSYSACYIRQFPNAYMEPVSMPAISSTITLDSSVTDGNSRWYIGYSYLDNAPIDRYELTATMNTLGSSQNARSEPGLNGNGDDRGVAHGYECTGIVHIGDDESEGTGFIVGDHLIATAAHCVRTDGGEFKTDLTISTYDRSGNPVEGGELTIAEIHVPENYINQLRTGYDYALVTVVEELCETDYVHFDIGNSYNMTSSEVGTIPLHVTGVPKMLGDDLNEENSDKKLYTHHGTIFGNDNVQVLKYNVDATSGQSGAPLYTITRERYNDDEYYTYTALGVVIRNNVTNNESVLMTKYHQQFYNNNPYANYQ